MTKRLNFTNKKGEKISIKLTEGTDGNGTLIAISSIFPQLKFNWLYEAAENNDSKKAHHESIALTSAWDWLTPEQRAILTIQTLFSDATIATVDDEKPAIQSDKDFAKQSSVWVLRYTGKSGTINTMEVSDDGCEVIKMAGSIRTSTDVEINKMMNGVMHHSIRVLLNAWEDLDDLGKAMCIVRIMYPDAVLLKQVSNRN